MAEKNKTNPGFKYRKSRSKLAPKKKEVVSRSKLAPKQAKVVGRSKRKSKYNSRASRPSLFPSNRRSLDIWEEVAKEAKDFRKLEAIKQDRKTLDKLEKLQRARKRREHWKTHPYPQEPKKAVPKKAKKRKPIDWMIHNSQRSLIS